MNNLSISTLALAVTLCMGCCESNAQTKLPKLYDRMFKDLQRQKTSSVTTDSNLTVVGAWPWGAVNAVAVKGNYAFIGNGTLIQTMDISNVSTPTVLAEYNIGSEVFDIKLRDTLLYVCSGRLEILSVSNPLSIARVGQLTTVSRAYQVVVIDSFAYVNQALITSGPISVVDISNPHNPYIRSSGYPAADWPVRIAVSNRRFIYASGLNIPYLTIIDASNPDSLSESTINEGSVDVAVQDTFLFLAENNIVDVESISDPINPIELGQCTTNSYVNTVFVQDSTAFVFADSGLFVFNISNKAQPVQIGSMPGQTPANSMTLVGNMMHIATAISYSIIDATNPQALTLKGQFVGGGEANDITVQGHYAYVATGWGGVQILDLTNPSLPVRVGVCLLSDDAWTISVKGNYAYVGASGLWTLDVSNPTLPTVSSFNPSSEATVMMTFADSNRVYCFDSAVTIYDATDPASPTKVGSYDPPYPYQPFAMWAKDTLLYIASQSNSFIVLDVRDPGNVFQIGSFSSYAGSILISDSLAYIVHENILSVIDINTPTYPELGHIIIPNTQGIAFLSISNQYLYVSVDTLVCVDITNPSLPKIVGSAYIDGLGRNAAYGDYLYICPPYSWGVEILKNNLVTSVSETHIHLPSEFWLSQNYPNPFNPTTTISYGVSKRTYVRLQVFNVLGQLVQTLVDGEKEPGNFTVPWDAGSVPSGVYFYRINAGSFVDTKKMVVIK